MTYKTAQNYFEELKNLNIIEIGKFCIKNDEFKMVEGVCANKDDMTILINDGIRIASMCYIVGEYARPLKPLQCFKCQEFNHLAAKCGAIIDVCV
jgi:hypothetical protein